MSGFVWKSRGSLRARKTTRVLSKKLKKNLGFFSSPWFSRQRQDVPIPNIYKIKLLIKPLTLYTQSPQNIQFIPLLSYNPLLLLTIPTKLSTISTQLTILNYFSLHSNQNVYSLLYSNNNQQQFSITLFLLICTNNFSHFQPSLQTTQPIFLQSSSNPTLHFSISIKSNITLFTSLLQSLISHQLFTPFIQNHLNSSQPLNHTFLPLTKNLKYQQFSPFLLTHYPTFLKFTHHYQTIHPTLQFFLIFIQGRLTSNKKFSFSKIQVYLPWISKWTFSFQFAIRF